MLILLQTSCMTLLFQCLNDSTLPRNEHNDKLVAAQLPLLTLIDDILYFVDPKQQGVKHCIVPVRLRNQLMEDGRVL